MMPVLVGISANNKGKTFPLDHDTIKIGRGGENVIVLDDASISTKHCVLTRSKESCLLKDLASTNGTRVNGKAIQETRLRNRDILQLGALEFIFADQQSDVIDALSPTSRRRSTPTVEVSSDPVVKPESFSSVSPFSVQGKDNRRMWQGVITVIGILALICVGLLFYILFFGG